MSPESDNLAELAAIRRVLVYIAILLSGVVFYFAKDIVMPIVLGLLITLTLTPVLRALGAIRIPAPVGALVLVVGLGSAISFGLSSLSGPLGDLFDSLPRMGERILGHFQPLEATLEEFSDAGNEIGGLASGGSEEAMRQAVAGGPALITSAASTLATSVTSLFIALVLSVFLLGSGTLFYEKIVHSVPALSAKKRALKIVREIENSVARYLFTITIINACLGLVVGGLLYAYGMPNAVLWGVIVATFNYLPFLGAIVGALLLAAASLGVYDTVGAAIIPPLIYYACTAIEGNVITPYIVGRRLQVNIVAVFLSVAFWGWLWGLPGALMAVPILVFVNVLCEHVDALKPFGYFITGRAVLPETGTGSNSAGSR